MIKQFNKISNYRISKKYFEDGLSVSCISKILKIDRRTVKKYIQFSDDDFYSMLKNDVTRKKKLDDYRTVIIKKITSEPELSARSIYKWLKLKYPSELFVSEKNVFNYLKSIREEFRISNKPEIRTLSSQIISGTLNKMELYEAIKKSIDKKDCDVIHENLTKKTIAYQFFKRNRKKN